MRDLNLRRTMSNPEKTLTKGESTKMTSDPRESTMETSERTREASLHLSQQKEQSWKGHLDGDSLETTLISRESLQWELSREESTAQTILSNQTQLITTSTIVTTIRTDKVQVQITNRREAIKTRESRSTEWSKMEALATTITSEDQDQ